MAKDFQDIQQLSSEENDHPFQRGEGPGTHGLNPRREHPFWKGPPPAQLLPQRLCSTVRFSLLALGFNILLLVVICVVGSQSARLQAELRTLEEAFSNFSSSTLMEIYALGTHGGSVGDKITSLGAKLEKQKQDLKAGQSLLGSRLPAPACEALPHGPALPDLPDGAPPQQRLPKDLLPRQLGGAPSQLLLVLSLGEGLGRGGEVLPAGERALGGHQLLGGAEIHRTTYEPLSHLDRSHRQRWFLEMGGWHRL
ncbi:asialoglycoprotein receptor 2 isoform X4 [Cebus imitator]|uniref:asialoglycoprotein receptor 2 isoform X4 n=1 Tax=Cebus imitator TaxID=2715852 RepID=UPI00080A691A|nr:asialoglycoprotein receptor 2 isoform X4 [Cebus imitator]